MGRIALVTGASRGIGRAVALRLAQEGADVAIGYFRNREGAEKTAAQIGELGRRAAVFRGHLGDEGKCHEVAAGAIEELGVPTILVSNAASGVLKPLMQIDERGWDWTMDVNCRALLVLVQSLHEAMATAGGGAVVALSSLGAPRVIPAYGTVGISKAALETLVRYLAVELGPDDIRVNAVSAGVVDTDSLARFPNRDDLLEAAEARTPAGRLLVPEDVAAVVAFLCSDDAFMVRGQVVTADGGYSLLG